MLASRDNFNMFTGISARSSGRQRDEITYSQDGLSAKVEARQAACGGPLSCALGVLGAKKIVCLSKVRHDGLENLPKR